MGFVPEHDEQSRRYVLKLKSLCMASSKDPAIGLKNKEVSTRQTFFHSKVDLCVFTRGLHCDELCRCLSVIADKACKIDMLIKSIYGGKELLCSLTNGSIDKYLGVDIETR